MTPLLRRSIAAAASAALLTITMSGARPTLAAQDAGAPKIKTKAKAQEKEKAKAKPKAEPADDAPAKPARKAPDPTRRVPSHFGALGLTDEQKEEIYAVEGKYIPQIQELQNKIEGLRERMMSDCEDVLTPAQKKILAEARKTAVDRRKAAAKSKDDAEE